MRINQEIVPFPINLKGLQKSDPVVLPVLRKQTENQIRSIYSYAKINFINPEYFSFNIWNLQKLCESEKKPAFLDIQLCRKLYLDYSNFEIDPVFSYKPRKNLQKKPLNEQLPPENISVSEKHENNDSLSINSDSIVISEKSVNEHNSTISCTCVIKEEKISDPPTAEVLNMTESSSDVKISTLTPKITLEKWESVEKHGDALEWLRNSEFLVNLNCEKASEQSKISLLINAISNIDLKTKIIQDLNECEKQDQTLTKLNEIVEKNTRRDCITYRKILKTIKYDSDQTLMELYSQIKRLVQKSMDMDPTKEKSSIEKLAISFFIEKLPKNIKQQLQTADFNDAESLVEKTEKIRSFQKLFLPSDENSSEVNLIRNKNVGKSENQRNGHQRNTQNQNFTRGNNNLNTNSGCFNCGDLNHIARNCPKPRQGRNQRTQNFHRNSNSHYDNRQTSRYQDRNSNYHRNNNQQNFQNNRNSGNFRHNGSNRNDYHQNIVCEYCGMKNHNYTNCRNLAGMIARGKVSPNWEPPRALPVNTEGGRAPVQNPLFK